MIFLRIFGYIALLQAVTARNEPPSVTDVEFSRVIKAKINETIKLLCPVRGNPTPFLEWRKDQELISELTMIRYSLNAKGSTLQIRKVECSDQGNYSCRGTNGYGSREVQFQLLVTDGSGNEACRTDPEPVGTFPKILQTIPKKSKNIILQPAGSYIKLRCIADGKPEPRIVWFKDGREIKESKEKNAKPAIRSSIVSTIADDEYSDEATPVEAVRSTLQAGDLSAKDSGTYTCRAWNANGFDEYSFYLEVVERAIPQLPEVHAEHPSNTTAVRGEHSMLTCKVKSDFPVDVYWLKRLDRSKLGTLEPSEQGNVTLLVPNKTITFENKIYQILPSDGVVKIGDGNYISKLGFQDPKESDSGFYVCLALNKVGMNFREAYFYVTASSRLLEDYFSKQPGTFLDEPSSIVTVVVLCSVLAALAVSVTVVCLIWTRGNRKSRARDFVKSNVSSAPRATPDSHTSSNEQTQSTSLLPVPQPARPDCHVVREARTTRMSQVPVAAQVHYSQPSRGNYKHYNHRRVPHCDGLAKYHSSRKPHYVPGSSHYDGSWNHHWRISSGNESFDCRVPRPTPETSFDETLPY